VRTFSRTSQLKKDVKLAERRGKDLSKLKVVIDFLINDEPLPLKYLDHPLRGDFAGSRDCHLEPDWLLIYTITNANTHVRFDRTGTHNDLFR
jgi:mRNA interferase YafQ